MKPELYYFEACPYCQRVLHFIEQNSIKNQILLKEIRKDQDYYKQLLSHTQDDQVPCLIHREDILLESEKIIHWLNQHLVQR